MQRASYPTLAFFVGLSLTILISYQMFWINYTYGIPQKGWNDFFRYSNMVGNTGNFEVTISPFIYRQLTPALVTIVQKLGLFYNKDIMFDYFNNYQGIVYSKNIYFSYLFVNWLALCLTGATIYLHFFLKERSLLSIGGILGIAFLLLSWGAQVFALSPENEGVSWLIIILIYVLAFHGIKKAEILISILLIISLFQRELISIMFFVIFATQLLYNTASPSFAILNARRSLICSLMCAVTMTVYFLFFYIIDPHPGYANQRHLSAIIKGILSIPSLLTSVEYVRNAFLTLNAVFIWSIISVIAIVKFKLKTDIGVVISILITLTALFIIGNAAQIGNNIGRILSLVTPILALQTSVQILRVAPSLSVCERARLP